MDKDAAMADVMATHIRMLHGAIKLAVKQSPADAVSMIADYFEECGVEDDETRGLLDAWERKRKRMQLPQAEYAFPHNNLSGQRGLSLRDYFAAKAMQSAASADLQPEVGAPEGMVRQVVAEWAYQMADAMLAAREKQG